jgi:flagellar basal body-associated protein FliL
MRRIITEEEKNKKKQRNQIIIGVILVGIMLLSTAGYAFYQTENQESKKISYKGIDFIYNGLWNFQIGSNVFSTTYNPIETENISVPAINFDYNKPLFFASEDLQATNEIARNLGYYFQRMQDACLYGHECSGDLPIKNCSDNIIVIEIKNNTRVMQENRCLFIQAEGDEILKASNAIIFKAVLK